MSSQLDSNIGEMQARIEELEKEIKAKDEKYEKRGERLIAQIL